MSEFGYYMKALKRFSPLKIKTYLSTLPNRLKMHKYFRFTRLSEKNNSEYVCIRGGELHFICRCDDITIPMHMYNTGRTFSDVDIDMFFDLCEKFYGYKPQKSDIFFDIGANIGTTSIYASKKYDDEIEVYAFEPEPENYKLLHANCILNNCQNIIPLNYAVSDCEDTLKLEITNRNRGANRIISDSTAHNEFPDDIIDVETIKIDSLISRQAIDPQRIKYIWIDVEGHEPKVIFGMHELLEKFRIPLYTEFSPKVTSKSEIQKMQDVLSKQYTSFIAIIDDNNTKELTIDKLVSLCDDSDFDQYNIFFY